jgi:hypothetical protein
MTGVETLADLQQVELPKARYRTARGLGDRVKSLSLTPAEMTDIVATAMDPQNLSVLLAKEGQDITISRATETGRQLPPIRLFAEDVQAILDSATPEQRKLAEILLAEYNGPIREDVNAASRKQRGVDLATRTNYYPRERDGEYRDVEPSLFVKTWATRMPEQWGHFKARTVSKAPLVIKDALVRYQEHVKRVYAYTGLQVPAEDALRVLGDPRLREAVKAQMKHGKEWLMDTENAVREMVSMSAGREKGDVDAAGRKIFRLLHRGILGGRPHINLIQEISVLNAQSEIDLKYWKRGFDKTLGTQDEVAAEIEEWSPTLRARQDGLSHEMLTPGSSGGSSMAFFYTGKQSSRWSEFGLKGIHKRDMKTIHRIWRMAKAEGMDAGLKGDALMERTAERAAEIVRRSQPTWDPMSISNIQREGRKNFWVRIGFTMYSTQRNKNFNQAVRAAREYQVSERTAADKAKFVKDIAVPTVINAAAVTAIRTLAYKAYALAGMGLLGLGVGLMTGVWRWPRTQPDEKWQRNYLLGVLESVIGLNLVGGDKIASAALKTFKAEADDRGLPPQGRPDIVTDTGEGLLRAGFYALKAWNEFWDKPKNLRFIDGKYQGQIKWRKSAQNAASELVAPLSVLLGLPLGMARAIGREPVKRLTGQRGEPLPENIRALADRASDLDAKARLHRVEVKMKLETADSSKLTAKEEAERGRLMRAVDLAKDTIESAKKVPGTRKEKAAAREAAEERADAMAKAALAGDRIFEAIDPQDKAELRFAYGELYRSMAEQAVTGEGLSPEAAEKAAEELDAKAADRGLNATEAMNKARGVVRSWYSTRMLSALRAGDAKEVAAYYRARLALGLTAPKIERYAIASIRKDELSKKKTAKIEKTWEAAKALVNSE